MKKSRFTEQQITFGLMKEEYVKKHLKKPEISNLRGTALGGGSPESVCGIHVLYEGNRFEFLLA